MNKYIKRSLVVVLSLSLTACGSNGYGFASWGNGWVGIDPNNPHDPNKPQQPNPPHIPFPPNEKPHTPHPERLADSNLFNLSKDELKHLLNDKDGLMVTLITPDGREFNHYLTTDATGKGENINKLSSIHSIHYTDDLVNSVYGIVDFSMAGGGHWEGFSLGNQTLEKEMPTTGVASYTGNAVGILNKNQGQLNNRGIGQVKINVDFGNSMLDGSITSNDNQGFGDGVTLQADIKGAMFTGEAKRIHSSDHAELIGQFNGPNAGEMSGFYNSARPDGMIGSFGAKKD